MGLRKLRMGMIGGGQGAFIGSVHRAAAQLDGKIELVCGVFGSSEENSIQTGRQLFLDEKRIYSSTEEMIQREKSLPEDERMDFVSIVTPNYLHYSQAKLALENGFHVVCDKPISLTLEEATALQDIANSNGLHFCLTHNYTGYPMVKQARHMVQSGALGTLRKVVVEYQQGWLADPIEQQNQKQASWRTDPKRAGASCCMGDIGSHAENLLQYITGLDIESVCSDVTATLPERILDDDGNVLLRMRGGVKGLLFASQIATGEENELKIRIYGSEGGIEWLQSNPNELAVLWKGKAREVQKAGVDKPYLCAAALKACRLPGGHPEGYLEAFANLYRAFSETLLENSPVDYPTIGDGIRGLQFIFAVLKSSSEDGAWIHLEKSNSIQPS